MAATVAAGSFHLPTRAKVTLFLACWPGHRKGRQAPGGLGISAAPPEGQAQGFAASSLTVAGSLFRPHLPNLKAPTNIMEPCGAQKDTLMETGCWLEHLRDPGQIC